MRDVRRIFELTDRVAVVTGVLGRLGPVWAEALLSAGAKVAGIDVKELAAGSPFARLLDEHGAGRVAFYQADVLDREALVEVRERCRRDLGAVSVLVNNAGIDQPPDGSARTYTVEEYPADLSRKVLDINVVGCLLVAQVFGEAMVRSGGGSIINIASMYASVSPEPRLYEHIPTDPPFLKPPAYSASKAALVSLTRYLAAHWGPHGVRVNALSPGGVLGEQDEQFQAKFTARVPLGRMAEARDLVGPLLFLASDASSYVTGIDLRVDGGYTAW